MKYENYLVVVNDKGIITYTLGRGYRFEIPGLAYAKTEGFSENYVIIDIASGLFVMKATSKKKLFQKWTDRLQNDEAYLDRIEEARSKDFYLARVAECSLEKRIWRESGYSIEGVAFEL